MILEAYREEKIHILAVLLKYRKINEYCLKRQVLS